MRLVSIVLLLSLGLVFTGKAQNQSSTGNTQFAFDLYHQLAKEQQDKNLFYSPLSISSAMAMTYLGSANQTKQQMMDVLYFNEDINKTAEQFSVLTEAYNLSEDKLTVNLANKLWAQKKYKFKSDYLTQVQNSFNAKVKYLDFKKQKGRNKAVKEINNWVDKETKHKIPKIVSNDDLNKYTRLVLTNAIYFKADWQFTFDKSNTRDGDFYSINNKKEKAEFMYQQRSFSYVENDKVQMLGMPYVGNELSMIILLPKEGLKLAEFERHLNPAFLQYLISNQEQEMLRVFIPKFKVESSYQLKESFMQMGLSEPFTKDADFSGISPKNDLKIHKIIHKGFIQVDEKGTEAAAATAVVMIKKTSIEMSKIFRADRPFVYLIRNNTTGDVLFMGRVVSMN